MSRWGDDLDYSLPARSERDLESFRIRVKYRDRLERENAMLRRERETETKRALNAIARVEELEALLENQPIRFTDIVIAFGAWARGSAWREGLAITIGALAMASLIHGMAALIPALFAGVGQ